MAEMKDIVKVAVDAYHGNVEQYSVGQSMEVHGTGRHEKCD